MKFDLLRNAVVTTKRQTKTAAGRKPELLEIPEIENELQNLYAAVYADDIDEAEAGRRFLESLYEEIPKLLRQGHTPAAIRRALFGESKQATKSWQTIFNDVKASYKHGLVIRHLFNGQEPAEELFDIPHPNRPDQFINIKKKVMAAIVAAVFRGHTPKEIVVTITRGQKATIPLAEFFELTPEQFNEKVLACKREYSEVFPTRNTGARELFVPRAVLQRFAEQQK